jgi:hypothetical protein
MNKNYHEKRIAHWYSVTSVLLTPLKERLIDITSSGFQNRFSLYLFRSNPLIILVLLLQIIWIIEFMRPNSQHASGFCFSTFYFLYHFNFPLMLKTFLLFVTVTMVSLQQPPVYCRSRKVEGNFMHTVNYR